MTTKLPFPDLKPMMVQAHLSGVSDLHISKITGVSRKTLVKVRVDGIGNITVDKYMEIYRKRNEIKRAAFLSAKQKENIEQASA